MQELVIGCLERILIYLLPLAGLVDITLYIGHILFIFHFEHPFVQFHADKSCARI